MSFEIPLQQLKKFCFYIRPKIKMASGTLNTCLFLKAIAANINKILACLLLIRFLKIVPYI